jgi:hypothetical protein
MTERTGPPLQKIQLNVDGKKILPPVRQPRQFFPFRNITELVIQGEKLFNPLKGKRMLFILKKLLKSLNFKVDIVLPSLLNITRDPWRVRQLKAAKDEAGA